MGWPPHHRARQLGWYAAEPPDKLQTLIDEARTEFERVLPELERAYAVNAKKPLVKSLRVIGLTPIKRIRSKFGLNILNALR